jgi:hypothetical protein
MKALALAAIASIYIVFLIPGFALALDSESGITSNPNSTMLASSGTISNPDSTTYVASGNGSSAQGYSSFAQGGLAFTNGDCQNPCRGFWKGLSYFGPCDALPKGAICLTYSDGYTWVVNDYRIDCAPIFAGVSNCKPIELIRCYGADYYHILGTSLIMSIPRPESICMRSLPNTCMPL